MGQNRMEEFLNSIRNTRQQEISCSECFDSVSHYVELELSGEDAARRLPEVIQHLGQCPACQAEYETLRDLRRLEEEGASPDLEDLFP